MQAELPPLPQTTDEFLKFDALAHAEELTGKSYKEDDETMKVGLGAHMIFNELKKTRLAEERDTHWGIPFVTFQQIMTELGFARVLHLPFTKEANDDSWPTTEEYFEVWFNRKYGALITTDTYTTADFDSPKELRSHYHTINSAHLQFNIEYSEGADLWDISMSSSPIDYVEGDPHRRACSLDLREGFRHNWKKLHEAGTFLTPWLKPYSSGGVDLYHYGDEHQMRMEKTGEKYGKTTHEDWREMRDRINAERWPMLPDYVRECTRGTDSNS